MSGLKRKLTIHGNGWLAVSLAGAAVVALPLLYIMTAWVQPPNDNWLQIRRYLLKDYLTDTVILVFFSCLFAAMLGVALAWFVAAFDFPLKRFFRWGLMLPLAVPPYIAAFTYGNMFSYTGTVQKALRAIGITPNPVLMDMLSMRGAVFIFTFFLYPYVYMIARAFLENQSASYIENARLLGKSPLAVFFQIVLPLSRPAMTGGVMLVLFEVLGDYGVTSHFGIRTFSTAIFQTWFGMYDADSAMRLASWLMLGVAALFGAERLFRRHRSFRVVNSRTRPLMPVRLHGWRAGLVVSLCGLVAAVSFVIPVTQLIVWAGWTYETVLNAGFVRLAWNTITLALAASVIVMLLAVIAAEALRPHKGGFGFAVSRVLIAGYSIPGAIVAIGVLGLFLFLDRAAAGLYAGWGLAVPPPVPSLTVAMLVFAYVVRFLAAGYNAAEAGMERIGPRYAEASRVLGLGRTRTFLRVELPLLRGALLAGFLLTFVEVVKELPLALLLRPFNFETLATHAYQYAGDERIHEASLPSLFIIGISLASVFVIQKAGKERRE
ncbi:iron ABC transporter permease [Paenibacillus aurantius]|uniref:Iron ABC transporter permease n=1 Tax=Paenibacillus aurantius TaxID=2918900 RepID=A0AA96LF15_9BACL|nr:iron ABC transporter permease [Paenibacillus aurantius]WNQ11823.1 iron ABC transporter permease [Paenibacillus aurantius]